MPAAKDDRNWAIWRAYRTQETTLAAVGAPHGIRQERVRQIIMKCDRVLQGRMHRGTLDTLRDYLDGVEFEFTNDPENLKDWFSIPGGDDYYRVVHTLPPAEKAPRKPAVRRPKPTHKTVDSLRRALAKAEAATKQWAARAEEHKYAADNLVALNRQQRDHADEKAAHYRRAFEREREEGIAHYERMSAELRDKEATIISLNVKLDKLTAWREDAIAFCPDLLQRDGLMVEARRIVAQQCRTGANAGNEDMEALAQKVESGRGDHLVAVRAVLAALEAAKQED